MALGGLLFGLVRYEVRVRRKVQSRDLPVSGF